MQVKSRVVIDHAALRRLSAAAATALEKTGEALHTDLVQSQTMPFDDPKVTEKRVYGKRGQFAKNGREYKGKLVKETVHRGGTLQNVGTRVDFSRSSAGTVSLVSDTPYARRLYFHPEYHFDTGENPHAGGEWFKPYQPGGEKEKFAQKAYAKLYKQEAGT